jgi:hypothetical protein
MSGISELRRFCHSITSTARLKEAMNFLQSKVPSLLASAEIWSTKKMTQKRLNDPKDIRKRRKKFETQVRAPWST